jgi:hypothetical protein
MEAGIEVGITASCFVLEWGKELVLQKRSGKRERDW